MQAKGLERRASTDGLNIRDTATEQSTTFAGFNDRTEGQGVRQPQGERSTSKTPTLSWRSMLMNSTEQRNEGKSIVIFTWPL